MAAYVIDSELFRDQYSTADMREIFSDRRTVQAWLDVEVALADAEAELGWVIAPAHQGRGYAREVIEELFRLCFDDLGVQAVQRMMPGGPLTNKQLKNLKVYAGPNHPHEAQSPVLVDVKSLNDKNDGKRA